MRYGDRECKQCTRHRQTIKQLIILMVFAIIVQISMICFMYYLMGR